MGFVRRDLFDRNVPRKPRPAMGGIGGVKGHNMKRTYLTGKPRPVVGASLFESVNQITLKSQCPVIRFPKKL